MITNNDYEKSVLLGGFINEVRDLVAEKEGITDILFTPVRGGYEVSFVNSGRNVRVIADVRGFFFKKLLIKRFADGKGTASYKARSKEEISRCAELLLTE